MISARCRSVSQAISTMPIVSPPKYGVSPSCLSILSNAVPSFALRSARASLSGERCALH